MSEWSDCLPQLGGPIFLTDGGLETELIYREGLDLPHFAAFDLLGSDGGLRTLERYYKRYAAIAREHGVGFILESATWRASSDWGAALGHSVEDLAWLNRRSIALLVEIRNELEQPGQPMVISGCVGPRGVGYVPSETMTKDSAARYHGAQVGAFAGTYADFVTAITMNYVEEAIGVGWAATTRGLPFVISFTVEVDGRLPTGQPLAEAIEQVDAEVGQGPAYYMVNCAHPDHFEKVLEPGAEWTARIRGLRGNASKRSHAELDEADAFDDGSPTELGADYRRILEMHPHINVLGGCCGTDARHIAAIAEACVAAA